MEVKVQYFLWSSQRHLVINNPIKNKTFLSKLIVSPWQWHQTCERRFLQLILQTFDKVITVMANKFNARDKKSPKYQSFLLLTWNLVNCLYHSIYFSAYPWKVNDFYTWQFTSFEHTCKLAWIVVIYWVNVFTKRKRSFREV